MFCKDICKTEWHKIKEHGYLQEFYLGQYPKETDDTL